VGSNDLNFGGGTVYLQEAAPSVFTNVKVENLTVMEMGIN
jgi:hypothetical protein